jgi:ribosome-binding protein aMBF1 (putative translation factor)
MARCTICKKSSEETELYPGILDSEMVMICEYCAEEEGVPVIKKPSEKQLDKADKRYSVRERMERMSGSYKNTEISEDQMITQGNLAKLRAPPKKQYHEEVLEDYSWNLKIARRRAKMSPGQLAKKTETSFETIQAIERGRIPENFREIFPKLESLFGIKLLKSHEPKLNFTRKRDQEREILELVKLKMKSPEPEINLKEKKEQLEKLSKGEADFSKRESMENVTLNDLVEMKRARESRNDRRKAKEQEESMLGEDLDLEEL